MDNIGGTEAMNVKDLKQNLKQALRQSGVVDNIRAQMRKEFISSMQQTTNQHIYSNALNINDKILYSIVYHTLRARNLTHSLSVFSAEVGFDAHTNGKLSEFDILQSLRIDGTKTSLYKAVMSHATSENTANCNPQNAPSILGCIIKECILNQNANTCTMGVQTDDITHPLSPGYNPAMASQSQFYDIKESLDHTIRDIRSSYSHKKKIEEELPSRSIEERMFTLRQAIRDEMESNFKVEHEKLYNQIHELKAALAHMTNKYNDLMSCRTQLNNKYEEERREFQ